MTTRPPDSISTETRRASTFPAHLLQLLSLCAVVLAPLSLQAGIITADGYTFTNFDGSNAGNMAGAGTNVNGIANNGAAVGFGIDNNGVFTNFIRNANGTLTNLNLTGTDPMAFGINSAGTVVGQENGGAFVLPSGGSAQTLNTGAGSTAFGINDKGDIVGQQNTGIATPGFLLPNGGNLITINAPSGPNAVNAQGVNNSGLVVGFYVGTDGQFHGFSANESSANNGNVTGTAITDPTIPNVAGEPGSTFVFSQVLGINDAGIAVGYYGDSTTSQHGFLYNVDTGVYTFLDDPAEAFSNGVEVTQITGITDSGELSGFYSDTNGVFHGFVACPVGSSCTGTSATPEPGSLILLSLGFGAVVLLCSKNRKGTRWAG